MNDRLIKKIIREELSKKEEVDEALLDPVRDTWSGVKGFFRGEGYNYYKYLSQLKNLSRDLKKLDKPNYGIMEKLKNINTEIQKSKMKPDQKQNIKTIIDNATYHFEEYSKYINAVESAITNKIS